MIKWFEDLFGMNDTHCRICRRELPFKGGYGCAFVGSGFCLECVQKLWREVRK